MSRVESLVVVRANALPNRMTKILSDSRKAFDWGQRAADWASFEPFRGLDYYMNY
jgi:hypothetical protein